VAAIHGGRIDGFATDHGGYDLPACLRMASPARIAERAKPQGACALAWFTLGSSSTKKTQGGMTEIEPKRTQQLRNARVSYHAGSRIGGYARGEQTGAPSVCCDARGTTMSQEQLTDQQAHVGVAEQETAAPDQSHGLPPHVYAQVMGLGPADAPALADLLILYSGLTPRILAVAAPHIGNAAVQRAIATVQGKSKAQGKPGALSQGELHELLDDAPAAKTQGKPGALSQGELHELLDDAPAATAQGKLSQGELHELLDDAPAAKAQGKPGTLSQGEMHELLDDAPAARTQGKPGTLSQGEMHELLDDAPAARAQGKPGTLSQGEMHELLDDAPAATAEPAWVGGARKYNAAHAELVADFNDATGNSCLDASGQLDPQAVRRWQAAHGVDADGKVGPHTLAAARQASAKAGPANVAADQRIPV
jgi:hypothetical protein